MIALDKELPLTCLTCPCLQTYSDVPDTVNNKNFAVRYCAAKNKILYKCEQPLNNSDYPYDWVSFKKPEWCPWKEV